VAKKVRPNTDLTFVPARSARRTAAQHLRQFVARQMVAAVGNFFVNTTGGLIVMAFKLCQEGSREPLVQRSVFNAVFEWKCLFTHLDFLL